MAPSASSPSRSRRSEDKKAGTLVGFLGEVDAGWKLFPLHTIKVITPSKRKIE